MSFTTILPNRIVCVAFQKVRPAMGFLILLIWCSANTFAQSASQTTPSPFNVRVTHVLGFENVANNANGTLSFRENDLQFKKEGKAAVGVEVASIHDVFLGGQSKQIGGIPMTLGKAAVPFGGGRAVSLFAHKKYDTVTLQYIDTNGGMHGAIFQLRQGQGEALRSELLARGAHVDAVSQPASQPTSEVTNENK